ncbi:hypothetical protein M0R04_13340 [Candidatus Dojkabacteria bacterium]|jgi:hypothetical protein|nr:hypothetical protein [Candidatus Dojkabacteria bacterium]
MKTTEGFALINKRGNLVLKDGQLPIYWMRKVAEREAPDYGAIVIKVSVSELTLKK